MEIPVLQTDRAKKIRSLGTWFVVSSAIVIFFVLCISSYVQKNNTYDEEYDVARGVIPWRTGNYTIYDYHPPLTHMITTIPVAVNRNFYVPEDYEKYEEKPQLLSYLLFFHNQISMERILYSCRFMVVVLGACVALLVFAWAKRLYGTGPALVSFLLCIFSPNMMAHSRLMTTDIGIALFYFLSCFLLWLWLQKKESKIRLIALGIVVGLAQISKFNAILLYPTIFLIITMDAFLSQPAGTPLLKKVTQAGVKTGILFGVIVLISLAVIYVGYGFTFANYFENFEKNTAGAILREQRHYFAGKIHYGKVWYLPIAIFFIKTSLPILILFITGLVAAVKKRKSFVEYATIYGIPFFYFAVCLIPQKNDQLRYYLPFFPFAFLMAGNAVAYLKETKFKWVVGVLLLWLIADNLMVYPNYLTFFNQIVGGAKNGHKYLLDSNYDWGQDLKGLKKYMDENGIEKVSLAYFGRADPEYYGINYDTIPTGRFSILRLHPEKRVPLPVKGWVAISANILQGYYLPEGYNDLYAPLRDAEPVARIGNTIFLYYLV